MATQLVFAAEQSVFRIATYTVELSRKGPGLLLRDILSGEDEQVLAVQRVIAEAQPDVLLLVGFDYDRDGIALGAFADQLEARGVAFPHRFARRPNTGLVTGLDLDGDGLLGGAQDAHGYGAFSGASGQAILSRFPVVADAASDHSHFLWKDLVGSALGTVADLSGISGADSLRLSSTAHWTVPIDLGPHGAVSLATIGATPPVFDGDEDRNGWRNHDEIALWHRLASKEARKHPAILLGKANLDPVEGEGRRTSLSALLADARFQDPKPRTKADGKGLSTAQFRPPPEGPGHLRVDYVLPDARLPVANSGVVWPRSDDPGAAHVERASRHRLVWVDLVVDSQS